MGHAPAAGLVGMGGPSRVPGHTHCRPHLRGGGRHAGDHPLSFPEARFSCEGSPHLLFL